MGRPRGSPHIVVGRRYKRVKQEFWCLKTLFCKKKYKNGYSCKKKVKFAIGNIPSVPRCVGRDLGKHH